jgi:hypothetical protein
MKDDVTTRRIGRMRGRGVALDDQNLRSHGAPGKRNLPSEVKEVPSPGGASYRRLGAVASVARESRTPSVSNQCVALLFVMICAFRRGGPKSLVIGVGARRDCEAAFRATAGRRTVRERTLGPGFLISSVFFASGPSWSLPAPPKEAESVPTLSGSET